MALIKPIFILYVIKKKTNQTRADWFVVQKENKQPRSNCYCKYFLYILLSMRTFYLLKQWYLLSLKFSYECSIQELDMSRFSHNSTLPQELQHLMELDIWFSDDITSFKTHFLATSTFFSRWTSQSTKTQQISRLLHKSNY